MNHNRKNVVLLGLIIYLLASAETSGDDIRVRRNQMFMISLKSSYSYGNPHRDVRLDCRLTGPDGSVSNYSGYWDGGDTFRIRMALPLEGEWSYRTICSDKTNRSLDGIEGKITVTRYDGPNLLRAKGWPRVSDDGRYLTYADGAPFFYLGDTAWELAWKSRPDDLRRYLSDRKAKGFTAIQVVIISTQVLETFGVKNRKGEAVFLDNDFYSINPRYFDYVDEIITAANDSEMVIGLVPLWAGMNELHVDLKYQRYSLTREQSLLLARYAAARFAGSAVVWIIGGDSSYETPERKSFWAEFARTIRSASGGRHLLTIHPRGYRSSYDDFDNSTEWLDFHMYQSSHIAGGDYTWRAGSVGSGLRPSKPLVNGEACYEDIYHNLWAPGDTTKVETFRIRAEHVRRASYESILSGALVGITYGANGVWQWHSTELPGSHQPRYSFEQAWNLPGSSHMGILKRIMSDVGWYKLAPRQELLRKFDSRFPIRVAANEDYIVAYFPESSPPAAMNFAGLGENVDYVWIDPATGGRIYQPSVRNEAQLYATMQPPDGRDWLLVASRDKTNSELTNMQGNPPTSSLSQNFPNPFNPSTVIRFSLSDDGPLSLAIYDLSGRLVETLVNENLPAGKYRVEWRAANLSSGIYYYRLKSERTSETKKMLYLK